MLKTTGEPEQFGILGNILICFLVELDEGAVPNTVEPNNGFPPLPSFALT